VNNLKTTSSRLLRKEFADRPGLSPARILVPLELHHHVWWSAACDPEQSIKQQQGPE